MSASGSFSHLINEYVYDTAGDLVGRVGSGSVRTETDNLYVNFRIHMLNGTIIQTPTIMINHSIEQPIRITFDPNAGTLIFAWDGNSVVTLIGTMIRPTRVSAFDREYLGTFIGTFEPATPKKTYPEMKCAGCQSKIHNPDHLERHLSPEQAEKYIEYCKKTQTEPTLYCCGCYDVIKNSRYFLAGWLELIRQIRKNEATEEKLEELLSRAERTNENALLIEQTYNRKLDELKKNPLKLVLAEITGIKLRRAKKSFVSTLKKYYGLDVVLDEEAVRNKKLKLKSWQKIIGLQLIRQEIINSSVIGYNHLHFGFGKPREGQTLPSIPIPFMRKPHAIKFI